MGLEDGDAVAEKAFSLIFGTVRNASTGQGPVAKILGAVSNLSGRLLKWTASTTVGMVKGGAGWLTGKLAGAEASLFGEAAAAVSSPAAVAAATKVGEDGRERIEFKFDLSEELGSLEAESPAEAVSELASAIEAELDAAGIGDITMFTLGEDGMAGLSFDAEDLGKVEAGLAQCEAISAARANALESRSVGVVGKEAVADALGAGIDGGIPEAALSDPKVQQILQESAAEAEAALQAAGVDAHIDIDSEGAMTVDCPKGQEAKLTETAKGLSEKMEADRAKEAKAAAGKERNTAGRKTSYEPVAERAKRVRRAKDDPRLRRRGPGKTGPSASKGKPGAK